jgi:hypothetical protein
VLRVLFVSDVAWVLSAFYSRAEFVVEIGARAPCVSSSLACAFFLDRAAFQDFRRGNVFPMKLGQVWGQLSACIAQGTCSFPSKRAVQRASVGVAI